MKKILSLLLLISVYLSSFGQADQNRFTKTPLTGANQNKVSIRDANLTAVYSLRVPVWSEWGLRNSKDSAGFIQYNSTLGQFGGYNGATWIPFGGGSYSLPIATASVLGGIKVGTGLSINSTTGVLSATGGVGGVSSVFGRTGDVVAQASDYSFYPLLSGSYANPSWITSLAYSKITGVPAFLTSETDPLFDTKFSGKSTTNLAEGSNLYFTQARVSANTNVAANTAARHNSVTLGTSNGLSLAGQQLSLGLASSGVTGAISGSDWDMFNSKQNQLTLTTTGSGAASLIGSTLNIPTPSGGSGNAALRVPVTLASNGTLIQITWATYSATFGSAPTDLSLIEVSASGDRQVFTNWYSDDNGVTYKFDVAPEVGSRNFVVVISGGSMVSSGNVTSVTSANGDISVTNSTTTPVLTLNSGTGANQIVKRNGSGLIADLAPYLTSATAASTYYPLSNPNGYISSAPSQVQNSLSPGSITLAPSVTSVNNALALKQSLLFYNVLDYGAVGDGVTNDSTAFANAIAAIPATGGTVYVPKTANHYYARIILRRSNITFFIEQGAVIDGGVFHIEGIGPGTVDYVPGSPITYRENIRVIGKLSVTERLGTYYAKNLFFDEIEVVKDSTAYIAQQADGGSRGVHFYWGTQDVYINKLTTRSTKVAEPQGALFIDANPSFIAQSTPKNFYINDVIVEDSKYNGLFLDNTDNIHFGNVNIRKSFYDGVSLRNVNNLTIESLSVTNINDNALNYNGISNVIIQNYITNSTGLRDVNNQSGTNVNIGYNQSLTFASDPFVQTGFAKLNVSSYNDLKDRPIIAGVYNGNLTVGTGVYGTLNVKGSTGSLIDFYKNSTLLGEIAMDEVNSSTSQSKFYTRFGGNTFNSLTLKGTSVLVNELAGSGDRPVFAGSDGTLKIGSSSFSGGTYTPTLTITSDPGGTITSAIPSITHYSRVGNQVTVYGSITISTSSGSTNRELQLTLPISSDLSVATDLSGTGNVRVNSTTFSSNMGIEGNSTNNNSVFTLNTTSGIFVLNYSYMYSIL